MTVTLPASDNHSKLVTPYTVSVAVGVVAGGISQSATIAMYGAVGGFYSWFVAFVVFRIWVVFANSGTEMDLMDALGDDPAFPLVCIGTAGVLVFRYLRVVSPNGTLPESGSESAFVIIVGTVATILGGIVLFLAGAFTLESVRRGIQKIQN